MTFCCWVWFCLSETTSLHSTSFCLQAGRWTKFRGKSFQSCRICFIRMACGLFLFFFHFIICFASHLYICVLQTAAPCFVSPQQSKAHNRRPTKLSVYQNRIFPPDFPMGLKKCIWISIPSWNLLMRDKRPHRHHSGGQWRVGSRPVSPISLPISLCGPTLASCVV